LGFQQSPDAWPIIALKIKFVHIKISDIFGHPVGLDGNLTRIMHEFTQLIPVSGQSGQICFILILTILCFAPLLFELGYQSEIEKIKTLRKTIRKLGKIAA